jgi:hydroxymethylpyrimidine/phosphomethylpyrimidine kinase
LFDDENSDVARAPIALTIAGSDSGGGAGIQADLKTFSALGVYGASVITAVTAQDTQRVYGVVELEPAFVAQQIDAVLDDIGADAVKTGMLSSAPIINAVAERVKHWNVTQLVVDPVMVAKGGDKLLRDDAVTALRERLLPLALVVTPNLPEAEVLLGRPVVTREERERAARDLVAMGCRAAVVKGGHADGDADDVVFDGERLTWLAGERVATGNTHGSGCAFSAAIAAGLARGLGVHDALAEAKAFIAGAIRHALAVGHGHGPVNPMWRVVP